MAKPHDRITELPDPDLVGDGGKGAEAMYEALDAEHTAAENRRRLEYVMAHLTMKQHELYILMSMNLTQEQIAAELGISQPTVSEREDALIEKIKFLLRKPYITPSNSGYSGGSL